MSFWLQRVELVGLVFWVLSLLFVSRAKPALIIAWHLIGVALSFALPVLTATRAQYQPLAAVVQISALGVLNGLLASVWCARQDPPVSKAPMLGITAAGLGIALLLVLMAVWIA